jgi:hypothetical protein
MSNPKSKEMLSIDKDELREMVRSAVAKKLEEGKSKSSDKPDPKDKKHRKDEKRDFKKEIENAKKRINVSKGKVKALKEQMEQEAMGGGVPGPMATDMPMEAGFGKKSDPYTIEELSLFIHRSHDFMNGYLYKALKKHLARQMKTGQYNPNKAPIVWMNLVDAAAKSYVEEHSDGAEDPDTVFPRPEKIQVAKELAKEFEENIKSGRESLESAIEAN